MRIKEWFSWHFPELNRIVSDNTVYVKVVDLIKTRAHFLENLEELTPQLEEYLVDAELVKQVIEAAPISMGQDLNETDLVN
jgi:nucleolar protein 56